ncbi:MAG: hypothetical protein M9884_14595 [Rhodocyclaceae bacterium]|nr:hypothetical protein [Rhodocyclaceae bacterium]
MNTRDKKKDPKDKKPHDGGQNELTDDELEDRGLTRHDGPVYIRANGTRSHAAKRQRRCREKKRLQGLISVTMLVPDRYSEFVKDFVKSLIANHPPAEAFLHAMQSGNVTNNATCNGLPSAGKSDTLNKEWQAVGKYYCGIKGGARWLPLRLIQLGFLEDIRQYELPAWMKYEHAQISPLNAIATGLMLGLMVA